MKNSSNPAQLSNEKTADLINQLNHLLADLQIHYQNLRGLHWNIKGQLFFSLHEKFEEYYTESAVIIDELAERILTLGGTPLHSFEDYLNEATIKAKKMYLMDMKHLRSFQKTIRYCFTNIEKL